jgi:hypothetical protein
MARQPIEKARFGLGIGARPSLPQLAKGTVAFLLLALRGPAYRPRARADFRFGADFRTACAVFGAVTSALAAPLAFTSAA